MIVFWRVLHIDGYFEWYINWCTIRVIAESTMADNVFQPSPIYLHLTRGWR